MAGARYLMHIDEELVIDADDAEEAIRAARSVVEDCVGSHGAHMHLVDFFDPDEKPRMTYEHARWYVPVIVDLFADDREGLRIALRSLVQAVAVHPAKAALSLVEHQPYCVLDTRDGGVEFDWTRVPETGEEAA